MNLNQIKQAVSRGDCVHWHNDFYRVIKGKSGKYLITCKRGSRGALIKQDGTTLVSAEDDFYLGYKGK